MLKNKQTHRFEFNLFDLSLKSYGELVSVTDIWQQADIIGQKYGLFNSKKTILDAPPLLALAVVRYTATELEKIANAFANIPSVGLTMDEISAGFDKLRFGLFGVVDKLARRHNITHEQARAMKISDAIGALMIDARVAVCQKNIEALWKQRRTKR